MARPYTAEERKQIKEEFLRAYEESMGLQYASARRAGVTVDTVNAWRKKDKKFDAAIKEIDENTADMVVGKLMENIMNGDRASLFFWLKCRRHWSETHKVEVEQKSEVDINAVIEDLKDMLKDED